MTTLASNHIKTVNTIGIEIETFGIERSRVRDHINVVVPTHRSTYQYNSADSSCSVWECKSDCSIAFNSGRRAGRNGTEIVSRKLSNSVESMEEIKSVVNVLNSIGSEVNKSCGLHVHVDVSSLTLDEVKFIVKRYRKFENEIDRFVPRSRRGNTNNYCRSLSGNNYNESASTIDRIVPIRSSKINTTCYLKYQTIEFRHHSSTLNNRKLENWIRFVVQFVEQSVKMYRAENSSSSNSQSVNVANLTEKERLLLASFKAYIQFPLPMGSIMDDFDMTERQFRHSLWKLRQCGNVIKSKRRNGITYYTMTRSMNESETASNDSNIITVDASDSLFNGIDAQVKDYFQAREIVLNR